LTFICQIVLSGFADNGCVMMTLISLRYLLLIISQRNVTAQFKAIKTNVKVPLNINRLALMNALPSVQWVGFGRIFCHLDYSESHCKWFVLGQKSFVNTWRNVGEKHVAMAT